MPLILRQPMPFKLINEQSEQIQSCRAAKPGGGPSRVSSLGFASCAHPHLRQTPELS